MTDESMNTIQINFPEAEKSQLEEAIKRFNELSSYLDDVKIKQQGDQYLLKLPISESAIFVQSFLKGFTRFSKERIRKDILKKLDRYLEFEDPGDLAATKSLEIIKSLVF